jgi:aminomethyltransferase
MDVKGRVLALVRVLVSADGIDLEMPASRIEPVERTLVHYRVAAPVRFARRDVAVLGLLGPSARDVLGRAGAEVPDLAAEDHVATSLASHPARVARAGDLPASGFVVHLEPSAREPVWSALRAAGALPLGRLALDALRVEDGRPWYGVDVTEDHLLHETGLLREYHSATKGCYVGQEVVARLEGRGGNVNRALRGLRLARPVEPGTAVSADGREVGRVTTAAVSPRLGPIAMAYVHRNHFAPGTAVDVAGVAATVASLPLEDR